jgi:hypothetical protein
VYSLAAERGSVLLISIVLVFVMTLLGLALFELGAIENRMALTSAADARAFEVAQAGIERALRELQDGFDNDTTGSESWADNDGLAPICSPSCVTTAYRPMTLANTSFPGGGSYAVEIMLITVPLANATSPYPIGLSCFRDAANVCTNLVFVRSTGTVTDSAAAGATSPAPAGYMARKTIQTVARAYAPSVFANGLVAGTPPALQPVNGNVEIAGSVQILGATIGGGPLPAINWNGAGAGIRNSLGDLGPTAPVPDNEILRRLPLQQAVCAPTTTPCATPNVFSLGAEVMVARPNTIAAINLAGNAFVGGSSGVLHATGGTTPTRLGKVPLDAIYVADGCQTATCSDSYAVTSPSQPPTVDLGAIGRAFPENPVSPFPSLTSPIRLGTPVFTHAGGLQTYFSTRAANMTAMLSANNMPGTAGGLTSSTANCSNPSCSQTIGFTNKNGDARRGRICWTRNTGVLTFGVSTAGNPCNTPATATDPLLVYNTSANGWRINRGAFSRGNTSCPGTQICYNGAAVIFNLNSVVSIEETTTSWCAVGNPPCTGEKFPTNDVMALITPGNVDIARTTTNVSRVMGFFYAAGDFTSRSAAAGTPTRIIGGIAANRFCFGGGSATGTCASGTSNIPEFVQAPGLGSTLNVAPAQDVRSLPEELLALAPSANGQAPKHYRVESVPRLWLECKPIAPAATLPTTPTGVCGYN